jgi:hypothetical protein
MEQRTPKQPRSMPMVIGGSVLTGVGGLGVLAGLLMLASAETRSNASKCFSNLPCNPPDYSGLAIGGVVAVVTGGVALAVGIPLILYGRKKVPVKAEPPRARFAPAMLIGLGSGALRWDF